MCFHEYEHKYIRLRIFLALKIAKIMEHIEKILKLDLDNCTYANMRGDEYLRRKVSDETCFRESKDKTTNTIPKEKTKYNCRVLLQIQPVYYSKKDKDVLEDTHYYPEVLLEQCIYTFFVNNKLIHDVLSFKQEFNENT